MRKATNIGYLEVIQTHGKNIDYKSFKKRHKTGETIIIIAGENVCGKNECLF